MPHIFSGDPDVLRSEKRKKILPVEVFERAVLSRLRYRDTAVDYGAGTGYFTEVLAKHFRRVYAVEAKVSMASILREELDKRGVKNVGIIISDTPQNFDFEIDFILFSNVLHEVDEPEKFLEWSRNARVVVVIEWKKIETELGPPVEERIEKQEMLKMAERNFRFVECPEIYPFHYTLVCYHEDDALDKSNDKTKKRS